MMVFTFTDCNGINLCAKSVSSAGSLYAREMRIYVEPAPSPFQSLNNDTRGYVLPDNLTMTPGPLPSGQASWRSSAASGSHGKQRRKGGDLGRERDLQPRLRDPRVDVHARIRKELHLATQHLSEFHESAQKHHIAPGLRQNTPAKFIVPQAPLHEQL